MARIDVGFVVVLVLMNLSQKMVILVAVYLSVPLPTCTVVGSIQLCFTFVRPS